MTSPTDTTKEQWGIGRLAAYRRDDYMFPREQSRAMKGRDWEELREEETFAAKFWKFQIGFWILFGPFLAIATGYWH